MELTDEWRFRVLTASRVSMKSILDIICAADEPCFFAFGRHTANDFLYTVGIFPGAPAIYICQSNARYSAFKVGIVDYMKIWVSRAFLALAGGLPNTLNPFAYNYKSFVVYFTHLLVFRRSHVYIPGPLFNRMLRGGLFNPGHVIGESIFHLLIDVLMKYVGHKYTLLDADRLCTTNSRRVRVYFRTGLKCYTCIRARPPLGWKNGSEVQFS